jgi:hypothetical protein
MSSKINTFSLDDQGKAYAALIGILSEVPAGSRLGLLKAVGGHFGHRVMPGQGLAMQHPNVPVVGRRAPRAPPQPPSRKPAKQREIETKISVLNLKISEKSSAIGARLPDDDLFIQERQQLFRALKDEKARGRGPQSGQSGQNLSASQ